MRGRTPSTRQKASWASADIPIILLVKTLRTWPRVHLSVCVGRTLVELFMTGLIGLIEDIKITCQLHVSSTPSQSDNSWQVRGPHSIRHDGAFPDLNRDNWGCSNMMRMTSATRIGLPWLVRVCDRGDSAKHGQLMESPRRRDKAQKQCVGRSERGSSRVRGLESDGPKGWSLGGWASQVEWQVWSVDVKSVFWRDSAEGSSLLKLFELKPKCKKKVLWDFCCPHLQSC